MFLEPCDIEFNEGEKKKNYAVKKKNKNQLCIISMYKYPITHLKIRTYVTHY